MGWATYLTASPHTLDGYYRTEDLADARITAGAAENPVVTLSKHGSASYKLPPGARAGVWEYSSSDSDFLPPAASDDERIADMKLSLQEAFRAYLEARRAWWESIAGSANAMTGLDRWAYAQVAVGDRIADGNWPSTALSMANRANRVAHITDVLRTGVRAEFDLFVGSSANAARWAGDSVADGAALHSDIITTAGATQDADGSPTVLTARIPTNFDPSEPTLRSS